MKTAVVTACYGGYDDILGQMPQDIDVDWICITDSSAAPAPWQVRAEPARASPMLAAKYVKTHPDLLGDYRWVIWVDANTETTAAGFAREAIAAAHDGIAAFRHPRRDCIYEEAEASLGRESQGGKYDGVPIKGQVASYLAEGHPAHGGLFACGTLVWDTADARALMFGARWFEECHRWTYQDQLSFPVVARRLGIEPGAFPHEQIEPHYRGRHHLGNKWQRIHAHRTPTLR